VKHIEKGYQNDAKRDPQISDFSYVCERVDFLEIIVFAKEKPTSS